MRIDKEMTIETHQAKKQTNNRVESDLYKII